MIWRVIIAFDNAAHSIFAKIECEEMSQVILKLKAICKKYRGENYLNECGKPTGLNINQDHQLRQTVDLQKRGEERNSDPVPIESFTEGEEDRL